MGAVQGFYPITTTLLLAYKCLLFHDYSPCAGYSMTFDKQDLAVFGKRTEAVQSACEAHTRPGMRMSFMYDRGDHLQLSAFSRGGLADLDL